MMYCGVVWCIAVWYGVMRCVVGCGAERCGVVWCGVAVACGVVWFGGVWCGVTVVRWCGVRCGVVCCGAV